MPTPFQSDPTRTKTLRDRFLAEMNKRFRTLRGKVRELVVELDAFGLQESSITVMIERQAWRFRTDGKKLEGFKTWLQGEIDQGILETTATGDPWTNTYIDSAYRKGVVRGYVDSHKEDLARSADFYQGSKEQFLRDAFHQPETVSKLRLLQTRAFEELRGVSATMSQQMGRVLASGLANGLHSSEIARQLYTIISKINKTRARAIARTEVIYAHAEGQLDAFERLGVEEVGVLAEWQTAGDDRVCDMCAPLEGVVMTVDEARGLIPRHPNCRCAWVPATRLEMEAGQKRSLRQKQRAIQESYAGSLTKKQRKILGTKAAQVGRERSTWLAKEKNFKAAGLKLRRKLT